jgi:hypothetical protein
LRCRGGTDGLRRAHGLHLLGETYHHETHIADDGQQHFAQRFRLCRLQAALRCPVGRQTEVSQCVKLAREAHRLRAEALGRRGGIEIFGRQQRLQHGGDDDIVIGIEAAHDGRDLGGRGALPHAFRRQIERKDGLHRRLQAVARRSVRADRFHRLEGRAGGFGRLLPVSYRPMPNPSPNNGHRDASETIART